MSNATGREGSFGEPRALRAPGHGDANDSSDRAERFRELANRIENFLCAQLDRCESLLAETPGDQTEAVALIQREILEQREQWQAERQEEFERLRKEANWLADAWKRLEAEERRIAAQRETLQACGKSAQHRLAAPAYRAAAEIASTRSPVQACGGSELAWVQFQQLRREIQQHARSAQS
jgi:hypothetical protein